MPNNNEDRNARERNYVQTRQVHFMKNKSITFLLATFALVFSASVYAGTSEATEKKGVSVDISSEESISHWRGSYDPLSRACARDRLKVSGSKFSWMGCRNAQIRAIDASATKFVFEVDRGARCGWAGWIIELATTSRESPSVSVKAYRDMEDHRVDEYKLFCAYSKNLD